MKCLRALATFWIFASYLPTVVFSEDIKPLGSMRCSSDTDIKGVRAIPYYQFGKPTGVRLFALKSDSIWFKKGLRNGDVLREFNGNLILNSCQLLEVQTQLEALKPNQLCSCSIRRIASEQTLDCSKPEF